ncbi:MAG: asparagine synthase (glutamine-hydrolyzing) [Pseudobdellovibrionaceae bacterium]
MCGITGHYHSKKDFQINPLEVNNAVQQLKKRGPDSQSVRILPGIGLGHSRLQIIDLNAISNQPMSDQSGRYTIVFNGEIFNYKDLRKELNINFKTQSDTEVLLYAYIKWGPACLERLNGFFAFVVYDNQEHSIFAALDRFGIKPFLYSQNKDSFYFASELKALSCFPIDKNISTSAINAFMNLTYIPGEQSIFINTKRLLPGHFLYLNKEDLKVQAYTSLDTVKPSKISFNDSKEVLMNLAQSATNYWIESDAPLGAFLSGGIDSSIVVALASQKISDLKTFSVTFPDSPFHNEGPFAASVAKRYGTVHTEIPLTTVDLYSCVDKVLNYLDEPFADSSAIPTFALSEQVRKHVTVALSGDGADEVFGGYEKHKAEFYAQQMHIFSGLAKVLEPLSYLTPESRDSYLTNKLRKINRFTQGLAMKESDRYLKWCSFTNKDLLKNLLQNQWQDDSWKEFLPFDKNSDWQGINKTLYKDTLMVLPNDMLTKVDMMSMANSIEVRPLLLDHRIVDFAFSLPSDYKVNFKNKKYLLLETFKHLLPSEVYSRPKHGFSIELMPFFRGSFWEQLNDIYLSERLIKEQNIFDWKTVESLLKEIKSGSTKDLQAITWSLVTFQNFWLKYKVGNYSI